VKLAIFDATGGTGKMLVKQALAEGFDIKVLARDPAKLSTHHERMKIITGDINNTESVSQVVNGVDAVISVLGSRANTKGKPITQGTQNIINAMKNHGVTRIIIVSTPSVSDANDLPDIRFKFAVGFIRIIARSAQEDIISTAQVVRNSNLDWTIVRVSTLSNADKTGHVKSGYVGKEMGMSITRADLADFLLKQVKDARFLHQSPIISN